ncbi:MAG: SPOR domain-containing protein [Clostridia bacterium]|nr:SPOR domain-containing protein [Clostridia bacterium]
MDENQYNTAKEDRLMQEHDLQHTDSVPRFHGQESSYYRTTGQYRPTDGITSGTYARTGFYRPPTFEQEPKAEAPQSTGYRYDDLSEASYSRIFSSSASAQEDRWGMYDFPVQSERQENPYFTDYFSTPKAPEPAPKAEPPRQEATPAQRGDASDDSFLHAFDADVRYDDAQDELRYDDAQDLPAKNEPKRERRSTKSRRSVKKDGKKWKIIALCVVLGLAAIGLGIFLVDRLVSPMMEFDADDVQDVLQEGELAPDSIPSADAEPTPTPTPDQTETADAQDDVPLVDRAFTINAWSVYLVQAGAFSNPDNADDYAISMRASGGAGYVIESDYFRVMTTAFNNEYDAGQLRDTLTAQSPSAQIYELSFSQMDFTVSAREEDVEVITTALSQWPELIKSLMTVIRRMEAGEITSQEAIVSIKEIYAQLETSKNALANVAGAKNSVLVRDLSNMYTEAARILYDVLEGGTLEKGPTLARVKFAHIGMCWNYRGLVEGIAEGTTQVVPEEETTAE